MDIKLLEGYDKARYRRMLKGTILLIAFNVFGPLFEWATDKSGFLDLPEGELGPWYVIALALGLLVIMVWLICLVVKWFLMRRQIGRDKELLAAWNNEMVRNNNYKAYKWGFFVALGVSFFVWIEPDFFFFLSPWIFDSAIFAYLISWLYYNRDMK